MMDRRMMDSRRGRRRDRGMDYGYDRRDYRDYGYSEYDSRRGDRAYSEHDMARTRMDYESGRQSDMGRMDYNSDMRRGRGRDGHYPMGQGSTYYPIEAMGTFNGYWGMPEEDYARGGRRDYGYDYNYDMRGSRDYRYDYAGDYGENLTMGEMEHWIKKMMSKLEEREKQMLSKDAVIQRAKTMGIQFDGFNEMEYYANVVKNYTDHKKTIGENLDMAMKLARDDFADEDGQYKGSEWLAVYFDTFVED